MKIDMAQFCATRDTRKHLFSPFRLNGFIYATDGEIAIRIPDDGSEVADCESGLEKIEHFFQMPENILFQQIPLLNITLKCAECSGTGFVNYVHVDCDECDGEGVFKHGAHDYDCKECNGSGEYRSVTLGSKNECNQCDGSGNQPIQAVAIGNTFLNHKYLVKMNNLPNCTIATNGKIERSYFKFDGGSGVIMPCRG
jgi:hypothetical protein